MFDQWSANMLYRSLRRSEERIRAESEHAADMRVALRLKTGHFPAGDQCSCGWRYGDYPPDRQQAVRSHVLTEWEAAAHA